MKDLYLSIVIPCYDEMANLQKGVLGKVENFLLKQTYSYEILIVDDGSTDGSIAFIEEYKKNNKNIILIKNNHLGKAGSVTTGMLRAKGKYVLFADMDQATPIEEINNLLPFFHEGYDIVIGSRNTQRKNAPWTRKLMARSLIILRKLVIGLPTIQDTQCGFKIFTQSSAKKLFSTLKTIHKGFPPITGSAVKAGFDIELLYLATKLNYTIKEVSVKWLYVETRRVSPLKDSLEGLLSLLQIKINDIQGHY